MRRIWKEPTGNLAGIMERFNTFMRRMVLFIVCFEDRAVYSLHATGALVDGIIHSIQALVRRQELKTATPFIIYGYTTFARTMKQHYLY